MNRPTVCFLFSRCRTGSTTITSTLNLHPEAVAFPEVLNGIQPHSYPSYIVERIATDAVARSEFLSKGPLFAFRQFLEELLQQALATKQGVRLVLFECKLENFWVFGNQWTHPEEGLDKNETLKQALGISDVVLFLRRINMLARYCSNYVANTTGVFHSPKGQAQAIQQLPAMTVKEVRPEKYIANFMRELNYDKHFIDLIKARHRKFSLIEYERIYEKDTNSFTSEFQEFVARVFDGIRLDGPAMSKVRQIRERDVISNYDDLEAAVRKTPVLCHMLDA
jgi:hypothetical protein